MQKLADSLSWRPEVVKTMLTVAMCRMGSKVISNRSDMENNMKVNSNLLGHVVQGLLSVHFRDECVCRGAEEL